MWRLMSRSVGTYLLITHWELLISLDACLVIILIRDIDMLIMLIFYLVCLSIKALILPWLFCSLHMYRLIVVYLSTWCVDSFACILSWSFLSMLSLSLFALIVIFLLSLRVDMCDISALRLIAYCMIALLLHDCMLVVCLGRRSIPLPPILRFLVISFISALTFASVRLCVCLFLWLS